MSVEDDLIDPCNLDLKGDFDSQVQIILDNIRLTKHEVEGLGQLFNDLQNTLQEIWPGCVVNPYGSIITGLGITSSDVDCYVAIPTWQQSPGDIYVIDAKRAMQRYPYLFKQLFAITQAKVPIVKFYHVPTQRQCDISFKSSNGVRNSKLLAYLLHFDPRGLPLTILIKYWSKVHKLTGTNLMPSYALILMVIFYLQQLEILPSVHMLQRKAKEHFVDIWNTGFQEIPQTIQNNDSIHSLFTGFFKFYNSFDFESQVISPYLGYAVKRTNFVALCSVPVELDLYICNIQKGLCKGLKIDTPICIQDPFELSRNCTVGMYFRLVKRVLAHIKFAHEICENNHNSNILSELLTTEVTGDFDRPKKNKKPPHKVTKTKHVHTLNKKYKNMQQFKVHNNFNKGKRRIY